MRAKLKKAFDDADRGTAAQMARDLGIDPTRVSKWRNGRELPPRKYRAHVEERLGLAVGTLSGATPPVDDDKLAEMIAAIARIERRLDVLEQRRPGPPRAPDDRADP